MPMAVWRISSIVSFPVKSVVGSAFTSKTCSSAIALR